MDPEILLAEPKYGGLRSYVDLIEKHWKFMLMFTAAASLCGAVYFIALPNEFVAQTQILVEKLEDPGKTIDQNRELLLPSMNAENDYIVTQSLIMTSDKILRRAAEAARLERQITVAASRTIAGPAIFSGSKGDWPAYLVETANVRGSRLITLRVHGPDPAVCQTLANSVADTYLKENARESLLVSQQAYRWLMDEGGVESEMTTDKKEAMIASLERIVKDPDIRRLEEQKSVIMADLRSASQKYRPKHPFIRQIADSLEKVNAEIQNRRQALTENLKDALKGESQISNVRILDYAALPDSPESPHRVWGWLMVTMLGFSCALIILTLKETLNRTIRTEADMPSEYKVPCLGAIPSSKGLKRSPNNRSAKTFIDVLNEDLELRDAIVSIRTHILFSMPFEKSRKIMFAGATPDKEESAVPILTALSMASMGRNIVLVDADLRNPRIHMDLGLENGRGLVDYLAGEAGIEAVTREVPGSRLKVIAGGAPNVNSSGLLATVRFDELIDRLTEKYDRVFINVPPILYVPDAMIVAKDVSCVVLVCSSGLTKKDSVLRAIDKFIAMNRPLMGYVINRVSRDRELIGQAEKDYKDYKTNYLQIQPYPIPGTSGEKRQLASAPLHGMNN